MSPIMRSLRVVAAGCAALGLFQGSSALDWVPASGWAAAGGEARQSAAEAGISSLRSDGEVAQILNADARQWKKARPFTVALAPQNMTEPRNDRPSIKSLKVRSIHSDRGWIAFLLEWDDRTRDDFPRPGHFADAVALEFPLDAKSPPAPMMGHQAGGRVEIVQWRADWQRDVLKGETKITDLYPNAVIDAPADKIYKGDDQVAFSAGRSLGNIVSQASKPRAVQALMAEGFGTLTTKATQNADGRGTGSKGRWRVVIVKARAAFADRDAAVVPSKSQGFVGFAAWDGSAGERGSRKSWAAWIPLTAGK